jgi:hypothetical protein
MLKLRAVPDDFKASPSEPERPAGTTNEQLVERMSGIEMKPREIAIVLGITEKEVNGYKEAIERGAAKAKFKVMNTGWLIATNPNHPKVATMNIFWQKSRYGMSDAPPQTVFGGGDADSSHLTDDEVDERFRATIAALRR